MMGYPQIFPAPIVLKKDRNERKIWNPMKLFKGDYNPAAAISQTYMKPEGPLNYQINGIIFIISDLDLTPTESVKVFF